LVLSQYVEPRSAVSLLDGRPGGVGYLLKERVTEIEEFTDALRRVARGELVMDPLVAAKMMGRRRTESVLERLTPRELEVLSLMAEGRSNHAIATRLVLTAKTVETHVRTIFQKLDLPQAADDHRRVRAVLQFLEQSQ
jgi:DNA-binding NarL/FixJ family response regulator